MKKLKRSYTNLLFSKHFFFRSNIKVDEKQLTEVIDKNFNRLASHTPKKVRGLFSDVSEDLEFWEQTLSLQSYFVSLLSLASDKQHRDHICKLLCAILSKQPNAAFGIW